MVDQVPGTVPVNDRRTPPRGVLPRAIQTWVMVALAGGILGIIVITGRPEPPKALSPTPQPTAATPNADRLRDYQDRLRVLDERARQQALTDPVIEPVPGLEPVDLDGPAVDPLEEEKKRREYQSLFATNLVLTRRSDGAKSAAMSTSIRQNPTDEIDNLPAPPTLDQIAEAVVRATAPQAPTALPAPHAPLAPGARARSTPPAPSAPAAPSARAFRLLEGTLIDAVLTNRLDGWIAAPVNCLVTNAVYSHDGQHVIIPAGARLLGRSQPVQTVNDTRLAVSFHRVVLPDGRTYSLNQMVGLNAAGDAGLHDRVNYHYLSTFGAAAAVGLLEGLSQALGNASLGNSGDRTIVMGRSIDSGSQSTAQVMQRFLNRLPTITIREGHRVKVYLTSDVDLPAYAAPSLTPPPNEP